jgi:hypothetical protein
MKLKTYLLAAVAAVATWPAHAGAQEIAQLVADRIAALANFETYALDCSNPCPAENTACSDGGCGSCSHCCHRMDLFGSAEFLLWWTKGSVTPPLVTGGPTGALPDSEVLFGREYLGDEVQAGGRVTFGFWLDDAHSVGAAARFYATGGATDRFASDDGPVLARPFFNVLLDVNDALRINTPGIASGSVQAHYANENFLGTEAYLTIMMEESRCRRVDLIAGYQFMRLDDRLLIESTHILLQAGNTQIDLRDRFSTENEFHGAQIGLRGQMMRGCWSLDALGKVAMGVTRQQVIIEGSNTVTPPGLQSEGGLLAQPTNIGEYQRDRFGFIPELTLNLRYHATPNCSFHVGYSLILWSDVVTSGRQIDTGVNPSQFFGGGLVGEARPAFEFDDEYYWLQGLNFGVNWDF